MQIKLQKILLLFVLGIFTLAGYIQPVDAQTTQRRKKLKATPVLKTNQRVVKVKSYVRDGSSVRAHKRIVTKKQH